LQNISLSVNDLLACCGFLCGSGCNGGYPLSAWRYLSNHGVVTEEVIRFPLGHHKNGYCLGTKILSSLSPRSSLQLMQFYFSEGSFHNLSYICFFLQTFLRSANSFMWQCDPYFDQTGCSHPGCEPAYRTPKCVKKCVSGNQLWKKSKHYSVNAYKVKSNPHDIMAEVYKNGPVEVAFTVYEVNENSYPRLAINSSATLMFNFKNSKHPICNL